MAGFAIPCVEMATLVWVQSVGKIALQISETTELTVLSHLPMDVVQDQPRNATIVKSTDCYGIQSVVMDITTSVAAFALQTANME
jgi:hypothetical protein